VRSNKELKLTKPSQDGAAQLNSVFGGPLESERVTAKQSVLSRRMRLVGWLCAFGIALVVFDLLRFLPQLPVHWWQPEQPVRIDVDGGAQFDFRIMHVDFGLAWLGSWGYLAAFVWIPVAIVKAFRARPHGVVTSRGERIIFVLLVALLCATSALVHLTPLRYPDYNVPLL
jgi:hypothetical protein